jgi:hypothetical protein
MNVKMKVGTVKVKEPYRKSLSHEVAAWHTEVEYPAGEYDVYLNISREKAFLYTEEIEGKIVDNYTPSLFGGVITGKGTGEEYIGKTHSQGISIYEGMLNNTEHNIEFKLDKTAAEWISVGYANEWKYDKSHPDYNNYLNMRHANFLLKEVINDRIYNKEYASKYGFDQSEKLLEAAQSRIDSSTYKNLIDMDKIVRKHTGKGLDQAGQSLTDAAEFLKHKSGVVHKIILQASKEFIEKNNISTKQEADRSFEA